MIFGLPIDNFTYNSFKPDMTFNLNFTYSALSFNFSQPSNNYLTLVIKTFINRNRLNKTWN